MITKGDIGKTNGSVEPFREKSNTNILEANIYSKQSNFNNCQRVTVFKYLKERFFETKQKPLCFTTHE